MDELGNMLAFGRGVEQNDAEAVLGYGKGAASGDPVSTYHLDVMYQSGRG
jgi:TPR repeat protein